MVKKIFLMAAVVVGSVFLMRVPAHSAFHSTLTAGTTYTIEVEAIKKSDGKPTSLGKSMDVKADVNGKIAFSFSGLPTRSSHNFLLVIIKDGENIVRRSIVPIAASGGTTSLGVSPMTREQTTAMLDAMSDAGSDDPMIVLFGSILIRSGGTTISANLDHLTAIGLRAIRGADPYDNSDDSDGGFYWYLLSKIGATKMDAFQSAIVSGLAAYTELLKDSVDVLDVGNIENTGKNERAKAASLLSKILIDAANAADFDLSYINAAMKAASDQQEAYLMSSESDGMHEAAISAMDCIMFANYMKLNAERVRQKYSTALSILGASHTQIERLNLAVSDLNDTMIVAFQAFEAAFEDEEGVLSDTDIKTLFGGDDNDSGIQDNMDAGFNAFMADIAATDGEIDDMITAMKNGFCHNNPDAEERLDDMEEEGMFKFHTMSGGESMNWPITMVVPVTWVANKEVEQDDYLDYTRDDTGSLPIPDAMNWLSTRTGFTGMPPSLAALFELREDVEIIQARKWAGLAAASMDMTYKGYLALGTVSLYDNPIDLDTGLPYSDQELAKDRQNGVNGQEGLTILGWAEENEDEPDDGVGDGTGDDFDGIALTDFAIYEDLAPYLIGAECQGIEELFITRLEGRQTALSTTSATDITPAQRKALVDTAMMPDFH